MKRLVVCCDGTWNRPDSRDVTNVEKIARTVQTDLPQSTGVQQLVYYIGGVGTEGYAADKLLGGAFGFGLFHNVIACYRFLAQNYDPADELFILGFSRGAYTARSLAGMIGKVGLLTKLALVQDQLSEAVRLYQDIRVSPGTPDPTIEAFKHDHCSTPTITFLGVFDTVGALGVPGLARAPRFHNVQLSSQVLCARQALAIDETRMKFAPTFWEAPAHGGPPDHEDPRVKQVWFEGYHSDVGGGYPQEETGLSDTALLWLVHEAHRAGLVFDATLLTLYVNSGSPDVLHDPLNPLFRADNLLLTLKAGLAGHSPNGFTHGLRDLTNDRALSVRVASSVADRFHDGSYRPENLATFAQATDDFRDIVEPVVPLPGPMVDLTPLGAS